MVDKTVPADKAAKTFLGRLTRGSVPRHELEFIGKMGRINREEAVALLQKHMGDREAVFRELASRHKS
ncbi:hypothetical protein [Mesorhizobium sp. 128a]